MDIAVIGMDCLLPGAENAEEWIANSRKGLRCLSPVPDERWPMCPQDVNSGELGRPDTTATTIGGFVTTELDQSDLDPIYRELDPLFTWAARVGKKAIGSVDLKGKRTALYAASLALPSSGAVRATAKGLFSSEEVAANEWLSGGHPLDLKQGGTLAQITANTLGITGEAIALDAACASSLYAVELACRQLRAGQLDMALTIGINRADSAYLFLGFSQLHALSRRGIPEPLGEHADGLVVGEGAAAVLLKRLDDAIADGDMIHGVIRDGSIGNDGYSGNLLAPNTEGQLRCLRQAYSNDRIPFESIGYLECHATGTPVGDKSELEAITALLSQSAVLPTHPIVLSSAKALIGHTVTAAGLAGLIRAIGAVRDGFLPPTPVDKTRSAIESHPHLRLLHETESWDAPIRRAGVSAFGFGGTNAHIVIENHQDTPSNLVQPPKRREGLAIVGVGAQFGRFTSAASLAKALHSDEPLTTSPPIEVSRGLNGLPEGAYMGSVSVPLGRFRIPPVELPNVLGQQLAILNACDEALEHYSGLDPSSTATVIGMEIDHHVSEHVVRWALQSQQPTTAKRISEPLDTAFVQGSLPNFVANRLSAQFGLQGPSFSVSAGALSTTAALRCAQLLLDDPKVSAVLVGATDQPGHPSRARNVNTTIGEGAFIFIVRRQQDAERDGETVLGVIDRVELGSNPIDDSTAPKHRSRCGHCGSADDALALFQTLMNPTSPQHVTLQDDLGLRATIEVTTGSFQVAERTLTAGQHISVPHSGPPLYPRLPFIGDWGGDTVPVPTPPRGEWMATSKFDGPASPANAPLNFRRWCAIAEPPPKSKRLETRRRPAPQSPSSNHIVPPKQRTNTSAATTPAGFQGSFAAAPDVAGFQPLVHLAQQLAQTQAATTEAHALFLEQERRFQDEMGRVGAMLETLKNALGQGGLPHTPRVNLPKPAVTPDPRLDFETSPSQDDSPSVYDHVALLTHAQGKLSDVFGPTYADLDDIEPRVRMPMPPLLLCSRVTAIQGERGVLGPSSLTTEYDIPQTAWWSHDGKAPPCVIVESGQADLFLVSYLGIDEICAGERLYRLLDCDLTFHDERPRLGETLEHSIRIKRFARLGETILFYFEYDCIATSDGRPILTMREGCAGFFTPAELANPQGLKLPAEQPTPVQLRPLIVKPPRELSKTAIEALTRADYSAAFGPDYASADGSPLRLSPTEYRMIHEVHGICFDGGTYGQGGLIAEQYLNDDDWYNACHFKGDPCMPGTLMFDGCNQALQTWLMAGGWASEYPDVATFEPIPEVTTRLRCRGQIVPGHSQVSYDVRVKNAGDSPHPWVIADVILSVDGTPVVLAENVSTRIVGERRPVKKVTRSEVLTPTIFEFSVGVPSIAFGPAFAPYDGPERRVARMPGPPLLLIDRAFNIDGNPLEVKADTSVCIDYTVPPDAWYFDADPTSAMPFVILLEAALQPCGWLTAWQGANLSGPKNTYFRNLGGKARYHTDVTPSSGTLTTHALQTSVSNAAGMSLHFFDYTVRCDDQVIFEGNTYFGYFTDEALADQKGLPLGTPELERRDALRAKGTITPIPLAEHPGMPRKDLLMLDAVTVALSSGGTHGLGYYEAEKTVNPDEWFFKAHFYQDPVMPGSLGLEALLQLSRWVLMERTGHSLGRIIPMLDDQEIEWVYRGQVTQERRQICVSIDVVEITEGDEAVIRCNGLLSADGIPLYSLQNFGLKIVTEAPQATNSSKPRPTPTAALLDQFVVDGDTGHGLLRIDPEQHPWLDDHRPTLTAAALPMAFAAEIAAEAAHAICPELKVIGVPRLQAKSWIHDANGPVDLMVVAVRQQDCVAVTLSVHHENKRFPRLSGPKVHMEAIVQLGENYPEVPDEPPALDSPLTCSMSAQEYYLGGHTFHGPSLHGMTSLGQRAPNGASSTFETKPDSQLLGHSAHQFVLDPLLLDTATHPMMSASPEIWSRQIPKGKLAYPVESTNMTFYGPRPSGAIRCELRVIEANEHHLAFSVWLIGSSGIWATFNWVEAIVDAGPLLAISPEQRVLSLIGDEPTEDIQLGKSAGTAWTVTSETIVDPMPGTTAALLCSSQELIPRKSSANVMVWDIRRVAAKECLQQYLVERLGRLIHPRNIELLELTEDRFIARHIAGLTAQEFIDHAGPTTVHVRVESADGTASAHIIAGPCTPSA